MSVEYYTRLERGNAKGVSEAVLEGISRALQLDGAEHAAFREVVDRYLTPERVAREEPGCRTIAATIVDGLPRDETVKTIASIGVPFAVLAFFVLGRTLDLPTVKREVHIDYAGALLLAGGVSALLVWVSLAGQQFDWASWQTAALVGGGIALLGLTVLVESRAVEPIIPLRFFRDPTVVLSAVASLFVGIAMFGGTVFLSLADPDKPAGLVVAKRLRELGVGVAATQGTADYLARFGQPVDEVVAKVSEGAGKTAVDLIGAGEVTLMQALSGG